MNSSTLTQLLTQKENLVLKMKELLLVNDIYNLQKIKKEYDYLNRKITHHMQHNTPQKDTCFVKDIADNYSSYTCVNYGNGKINPRYAKYYKDFKTPVQDNNLIIYKADVKEQCKVELDPRKKKEPPSEVQIMDEPPTQENEFIGESEYNNEYAEY